jgi:predicted RecA/RadA family phage recombinase
MARNYVQEGNTITMVAPTGGIASGEGYIFGSIFGVAQFDANQGEPVEVATVGVWLLPKPSSVISFAVGARVSWDTSARNCTVPGTSLYPIGIATAPAAATDATVRVRLNGVATVAA